ncbi:hypothetical protein G6M89_20635 [Natronolimnobius sp. AArcel1]|uniref:DUF7342 family protein n=1 Tax=Natronolimnobius sp. AArcel1 TaxID=1679093 RepID=UPI0013EAFCC2|nr:hypothetical protein [Natronolimnobius sp. AArcel1]NGM71373.1 hypothetical protein [Natronolimnobius sp. AArcel1]
MPESAPAFENVNERAKEDWKRDTSPFDRVRSVMRTAYEPMSAATVAETALTSEQTAGRHLRSLVEHSYVAETTSPDSRGALYQRAKDSIVLEQTRRILDETDTDTLSTRVLEMREDLREYGDRSGATSPDDAVRSHANIDAEALLEWRTTRRNLAFAEVALALSAVENLTDDAEAV